MIVAQMLQLRLQRFVAQIQAWAILKVTFIFLLKSAFPELFFSTVNSK